MKISTGKRIELFIFLSNFKSVKQFFNHMDEKFKRDAISRDTISNAINNTNITENTLKVIAKTLDVPIEMLKNENSMMDNYLNEEIHPLKNEYDRIKCSKDCSGYKEDIDHDENLEIWFEEDEDNSRFEMSYQFKIAKEKFDISNWFYPLTVSESISANSTYHIRTLGDVSVYLPLCSICDLTDILFRIGGDVEYREEYVLEQFNHLYHKIPEIPAKRYADYRVIYLRLIKKAALNAEELELKEKLEEYKKSDDYKIDYMQYYDFLERNYDVYRESSIRQTLMDKLPEIYKG